MKNTFISALLLQSLLLFTIKGITQKDFTPQWSKGIVWYQIFPERFENGDCSRFHRGHVCWRFDCRLTPGDCNVEVAGTVDAHSKEINDE